MKHSLFGVLTLCLASPLAAQSQPIPIRELGKPAAVSRDTIGFLYGVRELSDGRVILNDVTARHLALFDRSLASFKVIADSAIASESPYGRAATGMIPYTGDSTLLIDLSARAFAVFDGKGNMVRITTPPKPGDVGYMWNPALGSPRFDKQGRLIYRSWMMPKFSPPVAGKAYVPPEMPDSAPLLRGDFDRRSVDTLAWIRIAKMRISSTQLPGGGISLSPVINPLATLDDWAVLPDGTIAILRGLDYHVDWIAPDGSRTSSGKMPFDWKRLTDEEKAAIVDSTKAQLDRQANGGAIVNPLASVPGHDATGAPSGHSMTIMPVTTSDGGPPPKMEAPPKAGVPEVVSPKDLPDYMPPVLRSGTMKVDGRGNIWVLPSTSTQSAGGLLYDVINRAGQIVERVRLPAGRALEGFGSNGTIYLSVHSAEGTRLERY